jgi:hypothetical protein
MCRCTKKTITRDVDAWRQEGGFTQFLLDEFYHTYPDIKKEYPEKAFDRLCYLLDKSLIRKVESHHTEEIKEIRLEWKIDESNPQDKIRSSHRTNSIS